MAFSVFLLLPCHVTYLVNFRTLLYVLLFKQLNPVDFSDLPLSGCEERSHGTVGSFKYASKTFPVWLVKDSLDNLFSSLETINHPVLNRISEKPSFFELLELPFVAHPKEFFPWVLSIYVELELLNQLWFYDFWFYRFLSEIFIIKYPLRVPGVGLLNMAKWQDPSQRIRITRLCPQVSLGSAKDNLHFSPKVCSRDYFGVTASHPLCRCYVDDFVY